MESEIENKIERAKEIYKDEDDKDVIDNWKKRLERNALMKDYQSHAITKEIVSEASKRIKIINYQLANDDSLNSEYRTALFKEKKVYAWFLDLLSVNPEEELKAIEAELNKALE